MAELCFERCEARQTGAACVADEQFLLMRLAYSAIDVYAMVAVLSRASLALQKSLPSAEHEALLAQLICSEVRPAFSVISSSIKVPLNNGVYTIAAAA